jgi:amino-acid N-acetyltransferase
MAALEAAQLPNADLTDRHFDHFFYLGPQESPTGLIGCEIYGHEGLLRSLVVAPENRGVGTGSALIEWVENYARNQGVRAMYLLTITAEQFFARHGYVPMARQDLPNAIRSTREFAEICPASSILMVKSL